MKKQLNARVDERIIEMKDELIEKLEKEHIGKITTSTVMEIAIKKLYESEMRKSGYRYT